MALEDVIHGRNNARSKADYYGQHLFIRALCHTLTEDSGSQDDSVLDLPRSASPELIDHDDENWGKEHSFGMDDDRTVVGSASGSRFSTKRTTMRSRSVRMRDVENRSPPQEARFASLSSGDDRKARITNCDLIVQKFHN